MSECVCASVLVVLWSPIHPNLIDAEEANNVCVEKGKKNNSNHETFVRNQFVCWHVALVRDNCVGGSKPTVCFMCKKI